MTKITTTEPLCDNPWHGRDETPATVTRPFTVGGVAYETEGIARALAAKVSPRPVSRYELESPARSEADEDEAEEGTPEWYEPMPADSGPF